MKQISAQIAGLAVAFWIVACGALGERAPTDPAKVAAEARRVSVEACKAYHAAVALGVPPRAEAETACKAAQGVCAE